MLRRSPRLDSAANGGNAGESGRRKGKVPAEESQSQCRRRSPRLSPSVTDSPPRAVKRQRSRGPELPLNAVPKVQKSISDGKCIQEKSFRRSPRLASAHSEHERICQSISPQKMLLSLEKDKFEVALSNNSNLHSDAKPHLTTFHKETKPFEHSHVKLFGEKNMRRSPRLNPSRSHTNEAYVDQVKLRRSPRLSSSNLEVVVFQEERTSEKAHLENKNTKVLIGEKNMRWSPILSPSRCHAAEAYVERVNLRRSPRLVSSNGNENLEFIVFQEKRTSEKAHRENKHTKVFFGEKNMRCSPRLNPSRCHAAEAYVERVNLRRSPRLSSSNGNENLEVIVFQEKRTSKKAHRKNKNSEVISTSVELSNSPVEQPSGVKTISRNSTPEIDDTKCLTWSNEQTSSDYFALSELDDNPPRKKYKTSASSTNKSSFIGDPIPDDEAQKRWGWRYELKDKKCKDQVSKINEDEEDEIIVNVKCHYAQANVGNCIFTLGDCALVKGEGEEKYIGKIIEFFQTTNSQNYFRVQWFYRIQDTVVKDEGGFHDKRRLFYSSIMNDNLIDCIIAKANVTHIKPRVGLKLTSVLPSDFYYDMEYCVEYSTFRNIPTDNPVKIDKLSQPAVRESLSTDPSSISKSLPSSELHKTELALLDLYSGCGGMSTGLCLGAQTSSVNLVTRWAVDSDRSASESLKLNHPDTHVRNESAEDFLELLKEWEKLCKRYKVSDGERTMPLRSKSSGVKKQVNSQACDIPASEYEVSRLVDICYGDPSKTGKRSLYLKVHWKGHSESENTWEPIESVSKCKESMQDFVRRGIKSKILPLPGEVDVVCGGPPCQGISGYNRYRNTASPLDDERNRQIVVFMDIVKFLKPKYVLMENVVDILRFDKGSLGRYALSRLVHMNYQARLGIIAAGCYGLPQFRLRVFVWGAHPDEVLPQFPLPTHDVIVKYWPPAEFERNTVAYDEDQPREVEKAIVIQDAISDLPAVTNLETREEMSYQNPPETEFQRYIRSTKYEMTGSTINGTTEKRHLLYDHRPYFLFEDDYLRVCQIPKRKGANFRDLPGLVVGDDNVVRRHPTENPLLPSGKPLVPDYAFTFEHGKSKKPFGRLWWDETLPTALTFPSCHNQVVLHPEQDRVLTIREFARLQGFPDYYRFYGTVKERYCQIGNAVAIPVARALGYALGIAYRKLGGNEPLMNLPPKFSLSNHVQLSNNHLGDTD